MAYSAIPKSAQQMIRLFHRRSIPYAPSADLARRVTPPAKSTDAVQAAATAGLLQFLIVLAAISGLTCLYVWQAETISAIRAETQVMTQQAQALERRNVKPDGWSMPVGRTGLHRSGVHRIGHDARAGADSSPIARAQ